MGGMTERGKNKERSRGKKWWNVENTKKVMEEEGRMDRHRRLVNI